jgi:hypothetical protein
VLALWHFRLAGSSSLSIGWRRAAWRIRAEQSAAPAISFLWIAGGRARRRRSQDRSLRTPKLHRAPPTGFAKKKSRDLGQQAQLGPGDRATSATASSEPAGSSSKPRAICRIGPGGLASCYSMWRAIFAYGQQMCSTLVCVLRLTVSS